VAGFCEHVYEYYGFLQLFSYRPDFFVCYNRGEKDIVYVLCLVVTFVFPSK
jgi:hypothetical protein